MLERTSVVVSECARYTDHRECMEVGAVDPLISVDALARRLDDVVAHGVVVIDVRWRLAGPPTREDFLAGHIPGAVWADLDATFAGAPGRRGPASAARAGPPAVRASRAGHPRRHRSRGLRRRRLDCRRACLVGTALGR